MVGRNLQVMRFKRPVNPLEKIVPGVIVDIAPIEDTRDNDLMICRANDDGQIRFFGRIEKGTVIEVLIHEGNIIIGNDGELIFTNRMAIATYNWNDDKRNPDYQEILAYLRRAGL